MQPEKNQVFIFSDTELELIKNTFAENDELLYAIRNVLLQFELSDAQKQMIRNLTPETIKILRKRILPIPDGSYPIYQIPSLWTTLTNDIKTRGVEDMELLISAKLTELKYLEQQFAVFENLDAPQTLKLSAFAEVEGKSKEEAFIAMTAYLFLLGYIDPSLGMIKSIAGQKDETIIQQKHRLQRDSSK